MTHSRRITSREADVIRWLLASARTEPAIGIDSMIDDLVVSGSCACGCSSIDLDRGDGFRDASIAADAVAVWPDGARAGVVLWSRDGRIVALELYDMDPDSSHRFPDVSMLRTFADSSSS